MSLKLQACMKKYISKRLMAKACLIITRVLTE